MRVATLCLNEIPFCSNRAFKSWTPPVDPSTIQRVHRPKQIKAKSHKTNRRPTTISKPKNIPHTRTSRGKRKHAPFDGNLTPPSTSMHTLWHAVGPDATYLTRLGNEISLCGPRTSPSVGRRPSDAQSVPPQNRTAQGGCFDV